MKYKVRELEVLIEGVLGGRVRGREGVIDNYAEYLLLYRSYSIGQLIDTINKIILAYGIGDELNRRLSSKVIARI